METKTPRKVDPVRLKVIEKANAIVEEWVTPMRFNHVLDKFGEQDISRTGEFCKAMIEDIFREAKDEIVESKDACRAISKASGKMYSTHVKQVKQ